MTDDRWERLGGVPYPAYALKAQPMAHLCWSNYDTLWILTVRGMLVEEWQGREDAPAFDLANDRLSRVAARNV